MQMHSGSFKLIFGSTQLKEEFRDSAYLGPNEKTKSDWALDVLSFGIVPSERIWDALQLTCALPPSSLLSEILTCDPAVSSNISFPSASKSLLTSLNESQQSAVESIVLAVLAKPDGKYVPVKMY